MNHQERAQILWAVSFVVSGVVFILAFMYSPLVGTMVTLAYIMLYVGLSAVFLVIFREIEKLKKDTLNKLKDRREELEDVENAIRGKYYKKRIDPSSFRQIMRDYEKKLTEIEVKIKRLEGKKK
jgi:predicted membrane protein